MSLSKSARSWKRTESSFKSDSREFKNTDINSTIINNISKIILVPGVMTLVYVDILIPGVMMQ